jgi:hypothetical protein
MKKSIVVVTILAILLAMPAMASNDEKQSNRNVQITTDPKYDRNPSFFKAKDGTYWLFYTRGKDNRGIRGFQGYDPDLDYYDIYYRTSKSMEGLQKANDNIIRSKYPDNAQRDIAAFQARDGKIWLFASTGLGPGSERSVYYYKYGGTWSDPTPIPNTDYAAHIDALESHGKIWLFFDVGYILKITSYDGSAWSAPTDIHTDATVARATVEGGTFYVVWTTSSGSGIYLSTSPDGSTWTSTSATIASWPSLTNWDPVLIKDKDTFRLLWAPSNSEQFIATSTSTNPTNPSSWSTPVKLTTANNWWDFWPRPYKKGGSTYLFYTSERNSDGTERTDGNIWMLKLSGPHEDSED